MPPELARTTWRWVSLATPEETLTIAEPERYTLRFSDGDRVALRADCNRGAGSVVFPEPGAIRFGALATTRAMCPPAGDPGAKQRLSHALAGCSPHIWLMYSRRYRSRALHQSPEPVPPLATPSTW